MDTVVNRTLFNKLGIGVGEYGLYRIEESIEGGEIKTIEINVPKGFYWFVRRIRFNTDPETIKFRLEGWPGMKTQDITIGSELTPRPHLDIWPASPIRSTVKMIITNITASTVIFRCLIEFIEIEESKAKRLIDKITKSIV